MTDAIVTPTLTGQELALLIALLTTLVVSVAAFYLSKADRHEAVTYCRELLPPLTPAERLDARLGELSQRTTIPIMWDAYPRTAPTETARRNNVRPFQPLWRAHR